MAKYELRGRLPHGGTKNVVVESTNRKNAEAAAEAQTGGKVQGGGKTAAQLTQ